MNINLCDKICKECGFSKQGSTNTLYAEAYDIIKMGILFPCHMYLKSISGSESHGTEHLTDVLVCRGYVAYMRLNAPAFITAQKHWQHLFAKLTYDDLNHIYSYDELVANHKGLREHIFLNNPLGSEPCST